MTPRGPGGHSRTRPASGLSRSAPPFDPSCRAGPEGRARRRDAMTKKALTVVLDVREPSNVQLTLGDKVQLDRLIAARGSHMAERAGGLIGPGVAALALGPGLYTFRTLSDADLRVVSGGDEAIELDLRSEEHTSELQS